MLNSSPGGSYVTVRSVAAQVSLSSIRNIENQLNSVFQKHLGSFIKGSPTFSVETQKMAVSPGGLIRLIGASMNRATSHAKLVDGRLPEQLSSEIEIAITPQAAHDMHWQVGSTLRTSVTFSENNVQGTDVSRQLTLRVVGIFTPSQNDVFWHGETFDPELQLNGGLLYPVLISNEAFLSVLAHISSEKTLANFILYLPPFLFWYYDFDMSRLTSDTLGNLMNSLTSVLAEISNNPIDSPHVVQTVSLGPIDLLQEYNDRIGVLRIPLTSLIYMIAGLLLLFVGLMTNVLVDRQMEAVSLLRGRGASTSQICGSLVVQSIAIGMTSVPIGLFLAIIMTYILSRRILSPADYEVLQLITNSPVQVALSLWWLALTTVCAGILVMAFAISRMVRMDILEMRREAARSTHKPFWQRFRLDILAIVIGCVSFGFSFYITSPGVFGIRVQVLVLPVVRLVGTIFFLLGCVLLFLRAFPFILRLTARLAVRHRGVSPMLPLAQISRAPRQSLRMALLLALIIAFSIFTLTFTASQLQRISDAVTYQVGADFNGELPTTAINRPLKDQIAAYQHIPGVTSATVGYIAPERAIDNGVGATVELVAVDSDTYAQTIIWTKQDSTQSLGPLMTQLATRRTSAVKSGVLPAIVDSTAASALHLSMGVPFTLSDYQGPVQFVVIAEVAHLPTVNDTNQASGTDDYTPEGGVLVDLTSYANVSFARNGADISATNVWLRTLDDPESLANVRAALSGGYLKLDLVNDRRAITEALLHDPLYEASIGLLIIGTVATLLLALGGNLSVSWLNVRSRIKNFVVMRALGSTPSQIAQMLLWEQGIVYAVAIGSGIVCGLFLSLVMLPAFIFTSLPMNVIANQVNTGEFYLIQSVPPVQIVIPVLLLGVALIALIVICALTLGMMMRFILHPFIGQMLRLSED